MAINWTWTILFIAAALLALRFSWSTPMRPIGWGLVGGVLFSTFAVLALPPQWIGLEPAIFAIAELAVCCTAVYCLSRGPRHAGAIMVLNLTSCIVSLAYPAHQRDVSLIVYEEMVNALFALECLIQINTGLWAYAGDCYRRHRRLRHSRRNAMHALVRFRMASEQSQRSE